MEIRLLSVTRHSFRFPKVRFDTHEGWKIVFIGTPWGGWEVWFRF